MSVLNGQTGWQPPALQHANSSRSLNHLDDSTARTATPDDNAVGLVPEPPIDAEEENRRLHFSDIYRKTESRVALLFADDGFYNQNAIHALRRIPDTSSAILPPTTDHEPIQEPPHKKAKRVIDEDDYGDDDDEDEDEAEDAAPDGSKPQNNTAEGALLSPSKTGSSPVHSANSPKSIDKSKSLDDSQEATKAGTNGPKTLDDARMATEETARRSLHTLFRTLENDRAAMLEQQQFEDSEKRLQAEMDNSTTDNNFNAQAANQGSLSSANLGASSLTLKHLIARIDSKRDQVRASDAELRLLMSEVRKNRSKWTSEENVNQEELYEALEKVLTELKAHTEYSMPFLTRVNKRDVPDYYNVIKNPMDLGSMTKKLKMLSYKSKADFVTDLNLIWDNCLKFNRSADHPLRKLANGMRKEAEKLIRLIPDLTIRSRAEVEAEERRKQNGGEDEGGEDSDDEPIMSSRGRKAATKGASRKAPDEKEDTPVVDQKPLLQVNGLVKTGREGSEAVDGRNGFGTPMPGSNTPLGANGPSGIASNADGMEIDGPTLGALALDQAFGEAAEQPFEDEEYKLWKQTTKKDRAILAKERHALFKDNRLNTEAPASLRSKAAMRRFIKHQQEAHAYAISADGQADGSSSAAQEPNQKPTQTLAEEIEEEDEKVVPDYYEALSNIPDIPSSLRWIEDGEGQVINQHGDFLRLVQPGAFLAPQSKFVKKMDANIHQIQETRKLATKISVIKQMQVQTQVYTNQFPKSNAETFREADIDPHFISDDGPVMAPDTCQNALKRSIGKILYHAGFEELQPSAVDAFTGIAADYFQKLLNTFNVYREAEKKTVMVAGQTVMQPRFTPEEVLLHTLEESGTDLNSLETYAEDEVDRLSNKLGGLHERMKSHLTDLLRPALAAEAGNDGVGAFKDGSDQFVSGDFADDLGEDFFGFKALGLDQEFGLDTFAVPFHLLQSRVRNQYQQQTQDGGEQPTDLVEGLEPLEAVNRENIQDQIGLVKNFFLAKLHASGDIPLVEDEDLPVKQKKPRPRLGASGKIVTAQKRPPKEQIALAKKRKKMEAAAAEGKLLNGAGTTTATAAATAANVTPGKKKGGMVLPNGAGAVPNPAVLALAPGMERGESMQSQGGASQTDKDDGTGMMSPESIAQ